MNVTYGNGTTEYGPGVSIELTGYEVASAIDAWLVAHSVNVRDDRTIADILADMQLTDEEQSFVAAAVAMMAIRRNQLADTK